MCVRVSVSCIHTYMYDVCMCIYVIYIYIYIYMPCADIRKTLSLACFASATQVPI